MNKNIISADNTILFVFLFITSSFYIIMPVNPWPQDGWFQSQYSISIINLGADNFTPIAAPAYLYLAANKLSSYFEFNLQNEFYIASGLQYILIFMAALLVYRTLKLLFNTSLSFFISLLMLGVLLLKGIPMAFWSENIVIFLMTFQLAIIVYFFVHKENIEAWKCILLVVLMTLLTGLLVSTRMTPIFIAPAIVILLYTSLSKRTIAMLVISMLLGSLIFTQGLKIQNEKRFGRSEITNSTGRHLWGGMTPIAEETLAGNQEYENLKELHGYVNGQDWWEIEETINNAYPDISPEEMDAKIEYMAMEAIQSNPFGYLYLGIRKFIKTITRAPGRYGFAKGYYNPLNTDSYLLPLSTKFNLISEPINNIWQIIAKKTNSLINVIYPMFILALFIYFLKINIDFLPIFTRQASNVLTILLSTVLIVLLLNYIPLEPWEGRRQYGDYGIFRQLMYTIGCVAFLYILMGKSINIKYEKIQLQENYLHLYNFSFLVFIGTMYFSWQVETNNSRNALPYFPYLALMFAILAQHTMTILKTCKSNEK